MDSIMFSIPTYFEGCFVPKFQFHQPQPPIDLGIQTINAFLVTVLVPDQR
uniref:Uncharacterized protein n=1 Tax=Solanum lycopersicum TaxID=4081 RepID=A0A3Q7F1Q8_SOLLC